MPTPVIVIDFETTGLAPEHGARATEVAAVVVEDGRVVARYQSLMNAGCPIPFHIQALTGISNDMIGRAPPAADVMWELARFISDVPLVAHNAAFDRKFLDSELRRIRVRRRQEFICSLRIARRIYPQAPNHRLDTLVAYRSLASTGPHHRALADAHTTANLWLRMRSDLKRVYRLRQVPLDLMLRLQQVPKASVGQFVTEYRSRYQL